ncbi:hypothetical protein QAD02_003590 [Eretmocerus hayati]|uniref:Uncharacterized protein n=1 Tax=Eretmocerus hayati TaxID=131215 RepID=A0ACC2NN44_9HYME|nr:hypothetical protein QAD02_003590 [Eretmocerus hayati]
MVNLDSTKYANLPNRTNQHNASSSRVDAEVTEKSSSIQSITATEKRSRTPLSWNIEEFEAQGQAGLQILVWEKRHESDTSDRHEVSNLAGNSQPTAEKERHSQDKSVQNFEDARYQPVVNLTRLELPKASENEQQQISQGGQELQAEIGKANYRPDFNRTWAQPMEDDIETRDEQPHASLINATHQTPPPPDSPEFSGYQGMEIDEQSASETNQQNATGKFSNAESEMANEKAHQGQQHQRARRHGCRTPKRMRKTHF